MKPEHRKQFLQLVRQAREETVKPPAFWTLFGAEDAEVRAAKQKEANKRRREMFDFDARTDPDSIFWAMRYLSAREALTHFLICGVTGAGKTLAIELFLKSIAHRFKKQSAEPEQLIIFDAKCDIIPLLRRMGLGDGTGNFWILNPFDKRSTVWNVAEAVQNPALARALATLFVPEEKNSTTPYFADAARELVYVVILALCEIAGVNWTLRDLLWALSGRETIEAVCAQHPRARLVAKQHLSDEKHSASVLSTIGTKMGPFEQVAALWHNNPVSNPFTIQKFLATPGVLVLGNDPVLRESFWPINALLLKALTNEILRQPDTLTPRQWFVLDEFKAMGKVDCIHDLLNRGRSKGASVMLGLQSIEGLVETYGEHAANEIMILCANKMFLRAGGPYTAEWAERLFGKVRRIEEAHTSSWGSSGSSNSTQQSLQERSLLLASTFMDLPFPDPKQGYMAICDVPSLQRTTIIRRPFGTVLAWCGRTPGKGDGDGMKGDEKSMMRTDPKEQVLKPWSAEEQLLFCGAATIHGGKPMDIPDLKKRPLPRGFGIE